MSLPTRTTQGHPNTMSMSISSSCPNGPTPPSSSASSPSNIKQPGGGGIREDAYDSNLEFSDTEMGYGEDGIELGELGGLLGQQDRGQEQDRGDGGLSRYSSDQGGGRMGRSDGGGGDGGGQAGVGKTGSGEARVRKRQAGRRYTMDEEDSVVRKFDGRLVVFLAALYLVSFVDRSNIGNAHIAQMDEDLQTTPPKKDWYEWALTSFYLSYILFNWMSILWRLIPAHIYVFSIVLTWGLAASIQSITTSYPQLIVLRAILGIGEAAFTGVPFYLSFFFKREELAYRTAIFISAAPLATSFASLVAWAVLKVAGGHGDGMGTGIKPWRLLFLIEGLPSVVMAVVAWHKIPDRPETASFLTPRERAVAKWRLKEENTLMVASSSRSGRRHGEGRCKEAGIGAGAGMAALKDAGPWMTAAMLFLANMAYSSLPVFLPTILMDMGFPPLQAQGMSAPPYLASFLSVLAVSSFSDAGRSRSPYIIFSALASSFGYLILALAGPMGWGDAVRYAAVYPAAIGFFNVVPLVIAWNINNGRGTAERGVGFAVLQIIGQVGPLVGTRLYPKAEAPYYTMGMGVCCGAMAGVAGLGWGLRWWFGRVNGRLDGEEGMGGEEGRRLVGVGMMRRFRFML